MVIKRVSGVVILVEKSQRNGRLGIPIVKYIDILGRQIVFVHEIENDLSDRIVSYFGNESCRDTQSTQCNHGIERGTFRDGLCGKTVFEDDVENGFSDADNFTHKRFYFDSCSDCSRERCPK